MSKLIYITCIFLLSAVVKVYSIQCYQCESCPEVNSTQLVTCGATTTTQAPVTTDATGSDGTASPTIVTEATPGTEATSDVSASALSGSVKITINDLLEQADYICVTKTYTVNGSKVIDRGCILSSDEYRICAAPNKTVTCDYCNSDKCNGASAMQLSMLLMTIAIALKFAC